MAHQSIRPLAEVLLATDFADFRRFILKKSVRIRESTEKTLSNTKGTKLTKEFLRVFSKMLNFRANKL